MIILGTGGAGIAGSLAYLALSYILSAKYSLIVCSPLPIGVALCYFFIITKPGKFFRDVVCCEYVLCVVCRVHAVYCVVGACACYAL